MSIIQTPNPELYDGQTPIERVLHLLDKVKKHAGYYTASCPAHEDTHPSLSVSEGDGHVLLLKCHAGCTFLDIMRALDLPLEAAFPTEDAPLSQSAPPPKNSRESVVYDYRDELGELLFQSVKYDPKAFSQRHLNPDGVWENNLNGTRRILYRLPELVRADPDMIVFIPEGEKDVDRLRSLGFVSTTNPMGAGAGKWKIEYNDYLKDRAVVILPDNDEPGQKHAEDIAKHLTGVAASVQIVNLPFLPEKGDVSDYLDNGGDGASLMALAEAADLSDRYPVHWAREAIAIPPPVEWIVDGIMSRGTLSMFYGDAGTKKTWLLLSAAICIAKGIPWLGREVTQGPVLIIDEESGHRRLWSRMHQLMKGYGCLEDLPIAWITQTGFDLRNPIDVLKMRRNIEAIGPVFVIVDALMEVIAGADENSSQEVMPAIKLLRTMMQEYDIAGNVIHHANKGGGYRGSSALKGVVDQMLSVTSSSDNPIVTVHADKVRDIDCLDFAAEAHFETYPEGKVWFVNATPEPYKRKISNSKLTVLEALQSKGELTVKQIMEYAEERGICSPAAARQALYDLARDGEIKRIDKGGSGETATYGKL